MTDIYFEDIPVKKPKLAPYEPTRQPWKHDINLLDFVDWFPRTVFLIGGLFCAAAIIFVFLGALAKTLGDRFNPQYPDVVQLRK